MESLIISLPLIFIISIFLSISDSNNKCKIENLEEEQEERWEILKDYLKVKEEEYPDFELGCLIYDNFTKIPVKKTKLVKIKK